MRKRRLNMVGNSFVWLIVQHDDDLWKEIQNESPSPFQREMSPQIKLLSLPFSSTAGETE